MKCPTADLLDDGPSSVPLMLPLCVRDDFVDDGQVVTVESYDENWTRVRTGNCRYQLRTETIVGASRTDGTVIGQPNVGEIH